MTVIQHMLKGIREKLDRAEGLAARGEWPDFYQVLDCLELDIGSLRARGLIEDGEERKRNEDRERGLAGSSDNTGAHAG